MGGGVAVLSRRGVEPWPADGRVAAVEPDEVWARRNLVVCHRDTAELAATARALRDHLVDSVEATDGGRARRRGTPGLTRRVPFRLPAA